MTAWMERRSIWRKQKVTLENKAEISPVQFRCKRRDLNLTDGT